MLTCIACSKQLNNGSLHQLEEEEAVQTPSTKQAIKALTARIKDMAVKASGAYKNCKPCSGSSNGNKNTKYADSDNGSDSARCNANSTVRMWGKEMEAMVPIRQFAATNFRLLTAFSRIMMQLLQSSQVIQTIGSRSDGIYSDLGNQNQNSNLELESSDHDSTFHIT